MKMKMKMKECKKPSFSSIIILLLLLQPVNLLDLSNAQPNITGYTCSATYPCQTYVSYRTTPPDLLDLASIGDLFGVSRLMISKPSNLSSPTVNLTPDQNLLIPITCSCTANHSYANVTYEMNAGDTFYLVSTIKFQKLTTYQAVEIVNPSLVPTNVDIGAQVVFPIFCQCPNVTQIRNRINHLITYVFQPSDTLPSIAAKFGSNTQSLISVNGENIGPFNTVLVPVSGIPTLTTQPSVSSPLPSPPPPPPPPPPSSSSRERRGIIVGLAVGLGVSVVLLLLVLGTCLWWWVLWKNDKKGKGGDVSVKGLKKQKVGLGSFELESFMAGVSECLDKYKVYGIEELIEATSNFDPGSVIKGSVYKGFIGGEVLAIKKMNWSAYEQLKILQKVNHSNLVKLDGFCIEPEEGNCYLVYEYIKNGSLHSWLHGDDIRMPNKLDWKTRLQIAVDVASGLQYIHEHTMPPVVHKDIKTSNILLDENMRAKIANFGLAKSGCNAMTVHIVGTQGYISPEYLADGVVSTKIDVFAFGVVLLELVSGKEAIDGEGKALWMEAERVVKEESVKEWLDEVLAEQCNSSMDSLMTVMAVAKACLQRDASKRPSMVDVLYLLYKADEFCFDFSLDGIPVPSGVIAR